MSEPIIFKLTNAGKKAAFDANADTAVVHINIDRVVLGSGKYTPTGNETSIRTELARFDIVSGGVEVGSNTLRFSASMTANSLTPIHEIGLLTDTGVLFAVASRTSATPYFSLQPPIVFAGSFGLSLAELPASSINVVIDPEGAKSLIIMENHLAAPDPHPQYLNKNRFQLAMRALYPMGYQYHSHEPVNPKPIFDDILGLDTAWRRVTGKIFVSSDPSDPFINTYGLVLGQKGMTDVLASGARPHVYPLQTTHTFERYNPDDVIATVWKVVANKTAINEGGAVRFTVTANNLPDGQILNWSAKEGALNGSSNDITSPQKSDSGTVILRNGQAIIDFTTTPDDNVAEPQKHVRLTVGAPANLSINVPITDAGYNETALHITQSTTNGINLAEYYKQQSGSYPVAGDKIRFIIDAGVDIIAPNTSTPALTEGAAWPTGNVPIVENRGRILGRGGNGGRSAYRRRIFTESGANLLETYDKGNVAPPENGENGGTAVSAVRSIQIDNYNMVAGGGGGGGGMGSYKPTAGNHIVGGGGAGGGAPLGLASPNEGTYPMYTKDDTIVATLKIPESVFSLGANPTGIYQSIGTNSVGTKSYQLLGAGSDFYKGRIELDDMYEAKDVNETRTAFIPKVISTNSNGGIRTYRIGSAFSTVDSTSITLDMSQDASVSAGGAGGANYTPDTYNWITIIEPSSPSIDLKETTHGGSGGNIGLQGENGIISKYFSSESEVVTQESLLWRVPSANGGLAGYIKEGNVTITNFSGGTTKGR